MSITTTSTKDSYVGNGSTSTPYPITFKYLENSHITVYVDDVAISDSYYTLTGDGSAGTGQFTTSLEYTPSQSVVVVLDVPFDQPTALQETGALPAKTLEESFDRLNMQIRRVWLIDTDCPGNLFCKLPFNTGASITLLLIVSAVTDLLIPSIITELSSANTLPVKSPTT